jgi:CRP-like cAMP-binding protein
LIESEAHAVEASAMLELIGLQPRLGLHFMTVFAEELARTERRIESDLYTPAHTRVAKVIGDLYRLFGSSGQPSFRPPLNRRDIAELAGVTPETVSRAIAELRSAGVIETQGATFLVMDPRALVSDGERC